MRSACATGSGTRPSWTRPARVAEALGAHEHRVVDVDLRAIGGSALTDDIAGAAVARHRHPVTYVPARNTVLLALALGYAEVTGRARHLRWA
jgi:7-cyano-7-deazaguanine synthase